ncbi:MAG TPA: ABC transporter permease [Phycisphaerales bacterium]|nr:ABC transporter permease [Phycisphaerales bacterium]
MVLLPIDYAVRNLGRSPLRLWLWVSGSALMVLLVLAAGAFVRGMQHSLSVSGASDRVVLIGAGSEDSIERSEIAANVGALIAASVPGIRSVGGVPLVSAEVHMALPLKASVAAAQESMAVVRGVTSAALLVHTPVQIVAGRLPRAGADELMPGRMAAAKLGLPESALEIGQSLWIDERPWEIVGRFVAPGSVMESEVWTALTDLKIAARRETDSTVILALGTAELADIDAFTRQRLDLELAAMLESEYYAKLARFYAPVRAVAWGTAALIGLGGLFGGLNIMYAAFASRIREMAMLRCLGYTRGAIMLSLVQESVIAAAAGSLIGAAIGLGVLDGVAVPFSMGAFGLRVDAGALSVGLGAGLGMGLGGAILPAYRSLKAPITEALRAA